MGSDELVSEIFELEDKWDSILSLQEIKGEGYKARMLIVDSKDKEFELTKPLARKIVKELIEEFKLKFKEVKG